MRRLSWLSPKRSQLETTDLLSPALEVGLTHEDLDFSLAYR